MTLFRSSIALALLLMSAGCASIADGTLENTSFVTFSSVPTGARITSGQRLICITPCREQVAASDMSTLVATVEGRHPVQIQEQAAANLNIAGNVIFGGFAGVAIDALTGRAVRYPSTVHIIFAD